MNLEKNKNQVNNEILHIAKTLLPIFIFTTIVIVASIVTVSVIYDIPLQMMFTQLAETFKVVTTFIFGK